MGKAKTSKTTAKAAATRKPASQETEAKTSGPRKLKVAPYQSFKLQKKVKSPYKKLPSAWRLFRKATSVITQHWPLFLGIILIYAFLSIILAGSLSVAGSSDVSDFKPELVKNFGNTMTGLTLFAYIAGRNTTGGGTYQIILAIIMSLAFIWAIRQTYVKGNHRVRVRDSLYLGMTPLIPFVLVLIVLLIELIPLALGTLIYTSATSGGIAQTTMQHIAFGLISFLLALATFHMLTSSIFALYIVTLPDMTPVKALRSAVQLVRYRRVQIFIKLLFLVLALLVISLVIIVPLAIWATPTAPYIFFLLTLILLAVIHSYIYALYRELI